MAEKKTVSAREVVADIEVGMTDEQLMAKHGLSAKGLESLKKKLVTAGLLTAQKLDGKSPPTQVSGPAADKRVFAKNIADAVKGGLPDGEIIKRFGISAAKLPKVYESLIKAGYLTQEDLNRRGNGDAFEQTVDLAPDIVETLPKPNPSQAVPITPTETTKDVLRDFAQRFNIPREELERLKTASIKDIKAFFEKHNIPWSEGMELVKALGLRAGDFALDAAGKLKDKAKELISKVQAGEGQDTQGQKEPWYNNWVILLLLFMCFFPIGLYGLYKNTKLASRTKAMVAGAFCLLLVIAMIGNSGKETSVTSSTQKDVATKEAIKDQEKVHPAQPGSSPAASSPRMPSQDCEGRDRCRKIVLYTYNHTLSQIVGNPMEEEMKKKLATQQKQKLEECDQEYPCR